MERVGDKEVAGITGADSGGSPAGTIPGAAGELSGPPGVGQFSDTWTKPLLLGGFPRWFGLLALLALLFRAAVFVQYLSSPFLQPVVDDLYYWNWSAEIVSGKWIPHQVFFQSPLYPYFLALLKVVFPPLSPALVAALQLLMNWAACLLMVPFVRRTAGTTTAFASAALALFFTPAVYFSLKMLPTTLSLLLLMAGLSRLPSVPGSKGSGFTAGLLLGMAALAASSHLSVAAVLFLFLLFRPAAAGNRRQAVMFILGTALIVAPVTLSNYLQDGSLVVISSNFGVVFAGGNNINGNGTYSQVEGIAPSIFEEQASATRVAVRETGLPLNQGGVARHLFLKGLRFMADNPGLYLLQVVRKLSLLLGGLDIPFEFSMARERRDYLPSLWLLPVGGSIIMILAFLGLVFHDVRNDLFPTLLIALPSGLLCLVFYVTNRYALPFQFFLIPPAAAGVMRLREIVRRPVMLAVISPVILSAAFTWSMLRNSFWEEDYLVKLSLVYESTGNLEKREEVLRRWGSATPDSPFLHIRRSALYTARGDEEAALAAIGLAIELDPSNREARVRQARMFLKAKRYEDALRALPPPLEGNMPDTQTRLLKVEILATMGREAPAEEEARRALELDPLDSAAHFYLGRLLAQTGRREEGGLEFQRALELAGEDAPACFFLSQALFQAGAYGLARTAMGKSAALGFSVPGDYRDAVEALAEMQEGKP